MIKLWTWFWNYVMDRGWKNFEVSLDSVESSKRNEEDGRQRCYHVREYIHCHEQNVTRNVSIKGTFDKILEGNIRNWKKDDPCYKVLENLSENILLLNGK